MAPLREPTFFILLSLSTGPRHGYAILKEVERLSDGRLVLSTGTLYGAIKRLLADGWIRRAETTEGDVDGRDRKAYRLTEQGRRSMQAEIDRLRQLVDVAVAQAGGASG